MKLDTSNSLSFFITNNNYSLTTVHGVFLFGLAIGGFIISNIIDKLTKIKQIKLLVIMQIATGIYALIILSNLNIYPNTINLIESLLKKLGYSSEILSIILTGGILLFIPNCMIGASFPLYYTLVIKTYKEIGKKIASIYSFDLLGAIAGSLIIGFVIIPMFGLKSGFAFGALLNFLAAYLIYIKFANIKKMAIVGFLLLIIYLILLIPNNIIDKNRIINLIDNQNKIISQSQNNIIYETNSAYGLIQVINENEENTLYINYKRQCAKSIYLQKILVQMTLNSITKKELKVLHIGYGCGYTVANLLQNNRVKQIDIVEI